MERVYTKLDDVLISADNALRTLFGKPLVTERTSPAQLIEAADQLNEQQRRHSSGLMRVNHAGEVCAQALYQGQALTARDPRIREKLVRSAAEENDHLRWCEDRLSELGDRTSYLNPIWYLGSLALGFVAGIAGDQWNLGFLAETERQVVKHLSGHLELLPASDARSRVILEQMRVDEGYHAAVATSAGAHYLPPPVPTVMRWCSKLMTSVTYYV